MHHMRRQLRAGNQTDFLSIRNKAYSFLCYENYLSLSYFFFPGKMQPVRLVHMKRFNRQLLQFTHSILYSISDKFVCKQFRCGVFKFVFITDFATSAPTDCLRILN